MFTDRLNYEESQNNILSCDNATMGYDALKILPLQPTLNLTMGLIGYVPFGICLSNITKDIISNNFLIGLPSSDVMFLEILFIEETTTYYILRSLYPRQESSRVSWRGYLDCKLLFFSFTF